MSESSRVQHLHRLAVLLLPISLLILLAVIVLLFLVDASDETATRWFRDAFALFALSLLGYVAMQLVHGLRNAFSLSALFYTLAAALLGLTLLKIIATDPQGLRHLGVATGLYGLLLVAGLWWLGRQEALREPEREQDNDPGIRGSVSIFQTGGQDYRLVQRHPDPDTEASRFQARLLRYIERKTGHKLYAFSGDGCDFWKLSAGQSDAQLMVIGPGFNTRSTLARDNPWILRIRESAPWSFSNWMEAHFPEACARRRDLPGGQRQTQFSARCLEPGRDFFRQHIDPPDLDAPAESTLTPAELLALWAHLQQKDDREEGQAEPDQASPRRLH